MFYKYTVKEQDGKFTGFVQDLDLETQELSSPEEVKDALVKGLSAYVEVQFRRQKLPIPLPSEEPKEGDKVLYVPVRLQLRILLWNTMLKKRYRQADLAKMLGVSRAQAQMYVNGSSGVSVESYEKALKAMDVFPTVSLIDAEK